MDYMDEYLFDGIYVLMGEDGSVITDDGYPVIQYAWGKFWVNNHAHVLQGKNGVSTEHVMLSLKQSMLTPFVTGAVQDAIILALGAVLFVGMIDNVLRPFLIEGKTKMHTLLVFFAILGGIAYFGIIGMIIGPITVALGITFLELFRIEYQRELAKPEAK